MSSDTESVSAALIPPARAAMRDLRDHTGLSTPDIVNRAIQLYAAVDGAARSGGRSFTYAPGVHVTATPCEGCNGTGATVQGWTDKSGSPEDQYGPCARCNAEAVR